NIADAEERAYMQKGTYVTKLSDLDIGISNLTYFTSTYGTVYADKGSYLNIQVQRTVSAGGGLGSYWIALHVPVIPGTGSRTWECGPASNRCRQFILGK
ncbi:MAG: hypothetical protein J5706_07460, partial [Elusimicrobiales bacterium]|nr:hypothetical protein [Elusimicrobiales bacterium]